MLKNKIYWKYIKMSCRGPNCSSNKYVVNPSDTIENIEGNGEYGPDKGFNLSKNDIVELKKINKPESLTNKQQQKVIPIKGGKRRTRKVRKNKKTRKQRRRKQHKSRRH
jgi:hypothetical protein